MLVSSRVQVLQGQSVSVGVGDVSYCRYEKTTKRTISIPNSSQTSTFCYGRKAATWLQFGRGWKPSTKHPKCPCS